jgi:hypothetical protein
VVLEPQQQQQQQQRPDTDRPTPKDRDVWMFERRSAVSALEFPSILSPSRSRSPTPQSLSPPNDPARYREDLPGGESDRCHRSIRERGKSLFSPPLSRRATERATLVRRRSARRVNPPRGERDVFGSWPLSLSLSLFYFATTLVRRPDFSRSLPARGRYGDRSASVSGLRPAN